MNKFTKFLAESYINNFVNDMPVNKESFKYKVAEKYLNSIVEKGRTYVPYLNDPVFFPTDAMQKAASVYLTANGSSDIA